MKRILLSALALLPLCAHAATIQLNSDVCTATVTCIEPAQSIDYVSFNAQYSRVVASINGVTYDSGLYACPVTIAPQFDVNCVLYGPNNSVSIKATLSHWTTRTSSGRGGGSVVQHYQLLGGWIE